MNRGEFSSVCQDSLLVLSLHSGPLRFAEKCGDGLVLATESGYYNKLLAGKVLFHDEAHSMCT